MPTYLHVSIEQKHGRERGNKDISKCGLNL